MDRFVYHALLLFAIVTLESFPRFWFELSLDFAFVSRAVLLGLFLLVGWFFRVSLGAPWRWSVLSSMFFVDAVVAVALALLLVAQLVMPVFVLFAAVIILGRDALFAYLMADRVPHLRPLVFFACFALLVLGELVITFGLRVL